MHNDPEKALDRLAEETRTLEEGLEAEVKDDVEKAKGSDVGGRGALGLPQPN